MNFHLRHLQDGSDEEYATKAKVCTPLCDPSKTIFGNCNNFCNIFCDYCCKPNIPQPTHPYAPPPPIDGVNWRQHNKHHGISLYLTVSLVFLATAFFVFSCYTIYKLYFFRFRRRPPSDQQQEPRDEESGGDEYLDLDQGPAVDHHVWYIRTVGLDPSVISAISIVKFNKGVGLVESTDCAVCLSEFEEDDNLRLLPKCNHAFHVPCIDTWLRSHTNCPVCRAGIVSIATVSPPPTEALVAQNLEGTSDREAENEDPSELRVAIDESLDRTGLKISNEGEDNLGPNNIQPMRRSISMDFLSVNPISNTSSSSSSSSSQSSETKETNAGVVSTNINGINRGLLRLMGTSSSQPSSMKRSLSCSAKLFLHRYSIRGRNPVNPR